MGKTSDLFKKIGDTKGTFHAKTNKDRNGTDLTEAKAEEEMVRTHRRTLQGKF